MPKNPVRGAVLNKKIASLKVNYDGETYHCCILACKKRFKTHLARSAKYADPQKSKVSVETAECYPGEGESTSKMASAMEMALTKR